MTVDRRALAGAFAALLLVAACGGSATPAPAASEAAGATQAPAATQATEAPAETPAAVETQAPDDASGPDVSFVPGMAADLEAKLPSEVNGTAFTRTSFDGNTLPPGIPIGDSEMETFLKDNGKGLGDVRVAVATPAGTAATAAGTMIMAIQIKGVDSGKLSEWAIGQFGDGANKQSVGGKDVYGQVVPGAGGAYFYVKDDAVYYVVSFGGEAGLAEAILSKLP